MSYAVEGEHGKQEKGVKDRKTWTSQRAALAPTAG